MSGETALARPRQATGATRYARQVLLEDVGPDGQRRLEGARVVVVGLGALGGVQADLLARAGVGNLVLVDRDVVDATNLQRQTLYDESDVGRPKAAAAAERLAEVNSSIEVVAEATDFNPESGARLLEGATALADGTDNLATRFVMNDLSVKHGVPWVYAAAVSTYGMLFPAEPKGPCFECIFPAEPPRGSLPSCDTVGVLNTLTTAVGALGANLTIYRLLGKPVEARLISLDMRGVAFESIPVARREGCPACVEHAFAHLALPPDRVVELCGGDIVQVRPRAGTQVDLLSLKGRLSKSLKVRDADTALFFHAEGHDVVVFRDGRALVHGTQDPDRAKAIYARYIG